MGAGVVGNLPYKCTDEELTGSFSRAEQWTTFVSCATRRQVARVAAFVEMVSDDDAQKAINEFHQYQMEGRALVNEAQPGRPAETSAVEAAVTRVRRRSGGRRW